MILQNPQTPNTKRAKRGREAAPKNSLTMAAEPRRVIMSFVAVLEAIAL